MNYNITMKVSQHPLYQIWNGLVRRCRDKNNCNYYLYGDKGIDVCEEWAERGVWGTRETPPGFLRFLSYVEENLGERPEGTSLDRINNKGNYEPGNVRWTCQTQQNLNRSYGSMRGIRKKPSGNYQVRLCANGTEHYLGTYAIIEDAIKARDALLEELRQ